MLVGSDKDIRSDIVGTIASIVHKILEMVNLCIIPDPGAGILPADQAVHAKAQADQAVHEKAQADQAVHEKAPANLPANL